MGRWRAQRWCRFLSYRAVLQQHTEDAYLNSDERRKYWTWEDWDECFNVTFQAVVDVWSVQFIAQLLDQPGNFVVSCREIMLHRWADRTLCTDVITSRGLVWMEREEREERVREWEQKRAESHESLNEARCASRERHTGKTNNAFIPKLLILCLCNFRFTVQPRPAVYQQDAADYDERWTGKWRKDEE